MGTFRRRTIAIAAFLAVISVAADPGAEPEPPRSVNISSSWLLPQNDFPVFYRHFKDRVTWFEADAVCQFHHAQLVTVESANQFEAMRRYLKELDVTENVWIGLKRNSEASEFTWTNYQPLARSGYFREEVPRSSDPVCVVADPTANFKWHSLHCGGPEVASFVCELPVPNWASKSNGCMTNMVEGMTVTFLPEHPAIQLAKECSPGVSKNVTCKGNMNQSEIIEQLSCPNSNKLLKTLFKPVKPNLADVKSKTTTSSSESEVEDYVEMATIAQYNDETFQSISKVMGGRGTVGFPQEMSIAQEPIKPKGRNGYDTNGIDSAFIAAGAVTDTTDAAAAVTTVTASATTTTTAAVTTVTTSATTAAVTAATTATAASAVTAATRAAALPSAATTVTDAGTGKPAAAAAAAVATTTTATSTGNAGTQTAAAAAATTTAAAKTSTGTAAADRRPSTVETPRTTAAATNGHGPKTPYTVTAVTSAAAAATWDPIRVYKKIDLPQLYDAAGSPREPPVTVAPSPFNATIATAVHAGTSATTAVTGTTGATDETATRRGSQPPTTAQTAADDDRDSSNQTYGTPTAASGSPATTVTTSTAASVTSAAAASVDTATASVNTATASVNTATASATATAANHRKVVNYDSYADDHPNRSRHIVRPKQQHHHSYPYILYRLLG